MRDEIVHLNPGWDDDECHRRDRGPHASFPFAHFVFADNPPRRLDRLIRYFIGELDAGNAAREQDVWWEVRGVDCQGDMWIRGQRLSFRPMRRGREDERLDVPEITDGNDAWCSVGRDVDETRSDSNVEQILHNQAIVH